MLPRRVDRVKLMKLSYSVVCIIPYWIAKQLGWKPGDIVKLSIVNNNKILVEKVGTEKDIYLHLDSKILYKLLNEGKLLYNGSNLYLKRDGRLITLGEVRHWEFEVFLKPRNKDKVAKLFKEWGLLKGEVELYGG